MCFLFFWILILQDLCNLIKFDYYDRSVYTLKEADFIKAGSKYPNRRGFFEMVRFDFVLDSKMNVYLMEVNMSPNLSSKHFAGNRLLYEQVIYNLLRLVGVARPGKFVFYSKTCSWILNQFSSSMLLLKCMLLILNDNQRRLWNITILLQLCAFYYLFSL